MSSTLSDTFIMSPTFAAVLSGSIAIFPEISSVITIGSGCTTS